MIRPGSLEENRALTRDLLGLIEHARGALEVLDAACELLADHPPLGGVVHLKETTSVAIQEGLTAVSANLAESLRRLLIHAQKN